MRDILWRRGKQRTLMVMPVPYQYTSKMHRNLICEAQTSHGSAPVGLSRSMSACARLVPRSCTMRSKVRHYAVDPACNSCKYLLLHSPILEQGARARTHQNPLFRHRRVGRVDRSESHASSPGSVAIRLVTPTETHLAPLGLHKGIGGNHTSIRLPLCCERDRAL